TVVAVAKAWIEVMGAAPSGIDDAMRARVVFTSQQGIDLDCGAAPPPRATFGCAHLGRDPAVIVLRYDPTPDMVAHEICHEIARSSGILGGDHDHSDARIWAERSGIMWRAAADVGEAF